MYINKVTYPINKIQYSKVNSLKPSKTQDGLKQDGSIPPAYSYIKPSISFKSKEELKTFLREIDSKKSTEKEISITTEFAPPKKNPDSDRIYRRVMRESYGVQEAFNNVVNDSRYDSKDYDEVLLTIIRDNNFNVNKRYESGYSVTCNPLFILTTLNKPYLLQEALKRNNADPNIRCGFENYLTPLMRAVKTNSLDCAYVLLKSGKVNKSEVERCLNACSQSNKEMTELLNSYPNVDNYIESLEKIKTNLYEDKIKNVSEVLLNPKININFVDSNGNNVFHAINYIDNEEESIQLFFNAVNRNVNLNRRNNSGQTPIELYLKNQKYGLVCAAVEKGADLSVFNDKYKNTFAHKVASFVEENIAIRILDYAYDKGHSLDEQNFVGITPAISATKARKHRLLNFLINKGVSINTPDNNGMTPMHYACMLNDERLIEILLNNFVNLKIKDKFEKIATDYLKNPNLIEMCRNFQRML